jgi:16S rRNA (guanine966-N2)-methyltransferase
MRIIAGAARGRKLKPVRGQRVRPTADRVREAVFSILQSRLGGAGLAGRSVLDLFAGSGALGLEALSRGATGAVFVEADREAAETVRANVRHLGFETRARLLTETVDQVLARPDRAPELGGPFDLVFADPPYAGQLLPGVLRRLALGWLAPAALVVAEHAATDAGTVALSEPPPPLVLLDERRYGRTGLSIYGTAG